MDHHQNINEGNMSEHQAKSGDYFSYSIEKTLYHYQNTRTFKFPSRLLQVDTQDIPDIPKTHQQSEYDEKHYANSKMSKIIIKI